MIATVIVLGLGIALVAVWRLGRPFAHALQQILATVDGLSDALSKGQELHSRVMELEDQLDRLPSKWEAIQREAKSYYQRARHHIRNTQEELEARGLESPELTDLQRDLGDVQERNGGGGQQQGVLPLPQGVEAPPRPSWEPPSIEEIIAAKWR